MELISSTLVNTPIGDLRVVSTEDTLIYCNWDTAECERKLGKILALFHSSEVAKFPLLFEAEKQIDEFFLGSRKEFTLPLKLIGSPFQKRVWEEIKNIPYSQTITYKELAKKCGYEKGFRAIASACGANPLAVIIACHRIVSENGLGGYTGGLDKKLFLLNLEF